jgi:signal transduction histidine kinase
MSVRADLFLATVGWHRSGPQPPRVRLGWGLVLIAAGLALTQTSPLAEFYPAKFIPPLLAALVVAVSPASARRLVPVVLVALGLYGLVVERNAMEWYAGFRGSYGAPALALPLAYGFLLLGGWLWWRNPSRAGQSRSPEQRRRELLAWLLVPVVLLAGELFWPGVWFELGVAGLEWTALILALVLRVVRRWPGLAAQLATVGLVVVGLVGAVAAVSPSAVPQVRPGYVLDGLVALPYGQSLAAVALLQGLLLAAAGLLLSPATIPPVRRLVGLAPEGELAARVERLTETRAVAVDTAAADLRRLERDLHDGAQARLVALGMNLRAAERLIPTSPDAAVALVAEARETSARALAELRELVRGVHPPVLADRGLADALRALALDVPMRIETDIDLAGRLPAPVETACYFAVAELLANAAKHSGARAGRVSAEHSGEMLRVTVTDFGVGGADPARGTGLAGVEKRLAAFDGIVAVSSPAGGPTMVVLEVPCALSSPKISSC